MTNPDQTARDREAAQKKARQYIEQSEGMLDPFHYKNGFYDGIAHAREEVLEGLKAAEKIADDNRSLRFINNLTISKQEYFQNLEKERDSLKAEVKLLKAELGDAKEDRCSWEKSANKLGRYAEELKAELTQAREMLTTIQFERDEYKRLAESWMADHDKLKEKYEPLEAVESAKGAGNE